MSNNNKPLDTIRFGRVSVTIWENPSPEGKVYHSFTPARTYTDADGKPKSTASFGRSDLLSLAEALREAYSKSLTAKVVPELKAKKGKPKKEV